ncbi:MAG: hypothetical protein ACRDOI_00780 [Trebonia sp.]
MLSILTFVVAVVGVIGALFSLRQSYRARLRQFEEKYVQRYWAILDALSLAALSLSELPSSPEDERVIRQYILLCEDELQVRKAGYISDATYTEWADGMIGQLTQPMFAHVWEKIQEEATRPNRGAFPYENLRKLLTVAAEKDTTHEKLLQRTDPLKTPGIVRAIRGLKGIAGV